jgi:hypothetical protein
MRSGRRLTGWRDVIWAGPRELDLRKGLMLQKLQKWLATFFSAKRATKRHSPVSVSSSALPKFSVANGIRNNSCC